MEAIQAAQVIGKTCLLIIALAKHIHEGDMEKARQLAEKMLRFILPHLLNTLLKKKERLLKLLHRIINWDVLIKMVIQVSFDWIEVHPELTDRIKKEIDKIIEKTFGLMMSATYDAALHTLLRIMQVQFSEVRVSKDVSIFAIMGPKGKRVFLSFRW